MVKKTIQEIISKKCYLEGETLQTEALKDKLNPLMEKLLETVLKLKKCCNKAILATWFEEDQKNPILKEIESFVKIEILRSYRQQNDLNKLENRVSLPSKKTLFKVNAHFRFYYLWKETVNRSICFEEEQQKNILLLAYFEPCSEEYFHVKDSIIAEKLESISSKIKEVRNTGVEVVLSFAKKDSLTLQKDKENQVQDEPQEYGLEEYNSKNIKWTTSSLENNLPSKILLELGDDVVDYITGQKICEYSIRNISEGLRIKENTVNLILGEDQ